MQWLKLYFISILVGAVNINRPITHWAYRKLILDIKVQGPASITQLIFTDNILTTCTLV